MVKRLNSIEREKRLNNGGSRDREIDQIDYVGTKKARELNSIGLLKTPAGRSIVVDIVRPSRNTGEKVRAIPDNF